MVAVFTVQFFLSVVLWNWWVSNYDWMLRYALCRLLGQYLKPSFSLLLHLFGKSECVTGGSGTAQVVWTKHRSPRRGADMRSHTAIPPAQCTEVRRQPSGVSSVIDSGSLSPNSGQQAWTAHSSLTEFFLSASSNPWSFLFTEVWLLLHI